MIKTSWITLQLVSQGCSRNTYVSFSSFLLSRFNFRTPFLFCVGFLYLLLEPNISSSKSRALIHSCQGNLLCWDQMIKMRCNLSFGATWKEYELSNFG